MKYSAIVVSIIFIFVVFFLQIIEKHQGFSYDSGDTAVAQNALYNTLQGNLFFQPFLGVENNFREHISFVQVLFLPFFALYPDTLTLYFVIVVGYCMSALLLFFFAHKKLRSVWFALLVVALFIFHPLTAAQLFGPFHVAALAAPFLVLVLYAYAEKKYYLYLFGITLLFTIPEFIIPTIGMISIFTWWDGRAMRWVMPPLIASIALLLCAKYYITVGNGSVDRIVQLINPTHWSEIEKLDKRFEYLSKSFQPVLWVIPFFSRFAIVLLPSLLIILVISEYGRLKYGAHIVSVVPVILCFVVMDVLVRWSRYKYYIAGAVCVGVLCSLSSWYGWYHMTPSAFAREWRQAMTHIVDGGSVTADVSVAPYLANRTYLYLTDNKEYSDYIILKRSKHSLSIEENQKQGRDLSFHDQISISNDYVKIFQDGRVMVAIRKKKLLHLLSLPEQHTYSELDLISMYREKFTL